MYKSISMCEKKTLIEKRNDCNYILIDICLHGLYMKNQ